MSIWSDFKNSLRTDADRALLDGLVKKAGVDLDAMSPERALGEIPRLRGFIDTTDAESAGRAIDLLDAASGDFYSAIPLPSAPSLPAGPSRALLALWATRLTGDKELRDRITAFSGEERIQSLQDLATRLHSMTLQEGGFLAMPAEARRSLL